MFVCGDAAGVSCERTAYTADLMATVVAKNIKMRVAAGGRAEALLEFPGVGGFILMFSVGMPFWQLHWFGIQRCAIQEL